MTLKGMVHAVPRLLKSRNCWGHRISHSSYFSIDKSNHNLFRGGFCEPGYPPRDITVCGWITCSVRTP